MKLHHLLQKCSFFLIKLAVFWPAAALVWNYMEWRMKIDPPKAERMMESLSHRGVGLMPYGPEAEA